MLDERHADWDFIYDGHLSIGPSASSFLGIYTIYEYMRHGWG